MDEQLMQLVRDQFKQVNDNLNRLHEDMVTHIETDHDYWKKVDRAEGQITLLKWLASSGPIGAVILWIYTKLGGH